MMNTVYTEGLGNRPPTHDSKEHKHTKGEDVDVTVGLRGNVIVSEMRGGL